MAVLEIRLVGDPVLRLHAKPVPKVTKRIARLLRDMEDTMHANNGAGLAAPQVGVSERAIVVDVGDGPVYLVNPMIVARSGKQLETEGCLSTPGVSGYVERADHVVVVGLDAKGKQRRINASDWFAVALQHEIDHLDGVLFIDKATGIKNKQEKSGKPAKQAE